jgi:hypothetical protein
MNGKNPCGCGLKASLRMLFSDHMVYDRLVTGSILDSLPDLPFLKQRLMKNQEDIGSAIGVHTSTEFGEQLTQLLKEHIIGGETIVKNLKTGSPELEKSKIDAFENANKLARHFNKLDQYMFAKELMEEQFQKHVQYMIDIGEKHFKQQFEKEILLVDEAYRHAMMLSDIISAGVERLMHGGESRSRTNKRMSRNKSRRNTRN